MVHYAQIWLAVAYAEDFGFSYQGEFEKSETTLQR